MANVYSVCYIPVGEDSEVDGRYEENEYMQIGVIADSAEQAIKKVKDNTIGEVIKWPDSEDSKEKWKEEICGRIVILCVEHVITIDIL